MRCDACLQTRLGSNRQTISQSDKRAQNREPKNRSQKKEKVAKSRERGVGR